MYSRPSYPRPRRSGRRGKREEREGRRREKKKKIMLRKVARPMARRHSLNLLTEIRFDPLTTPPLPTPGNRTFSKAKIATLLKPYCYSNLLGNRYKGLQAMRPLMCQASSEGSCLEERAMLGAHNWTIYGSMDEQIMCAERKANRRAEKAAYSAMRPISV